MHISFSPIRSDDLVLSLEKAAGDRLRINGQLFNFNPLEEGDTIPAGSVPCDMILGDVVRLDGEVRLTLLLPHGPNPSQAVAFPAPISTTQDGPIAVPSDPAPIEEPADVDA
jgi:hypothetical protein